MDQTQPIIQYTTVSDSVYLWVKNAIIQGEFKPGEHIAQERLTKTLGVSRTPVRDAIKRLEAEGLSDHETALWGSRVPALQGTSDGNLRHPYPDGAVLRRQNLYQGK